MSLIPAQGFIMFVLCGLLALSQPSGESPAMNPPSPFRLTIRQADSLSVIAVLKNVSGSPQYYLHDADLQPSKARLRKGKGKDVSPFDDRSVKKFDPTVYKAMYLTLEPGKEVTLQTGRFVKTDGGTYEFRWNPFSYEKLSAGKWKLTVEWTSAENSWEDSETHAMGLLDDVWIGKVTSNSIDISLPSSPKNGSKGSK